MQFEEAVWFFCKLSHFRDVYEVVSIVWFEGLILSTVRAYTEGAFAGQAYVSQDVQSQPAKNSFWYTGWESQQQRQKLRPASQISSVSTAVACMTGCSVRTLCHFEAELYVTYCMFQFEQCRHEAALKEYLWGSVHNASGQKGGLSCRIQGLHR